MFRSFQGKYLSKHPRKEQIEFVGSTDRGAVVIQLSNYLGPFSQRMDIILRES